MSFKACPRILPSCLIFSMYLQQTLHHIFTTIWRPSHSLISYPKLGICHRLKVPSWTPCCLDIFTYDRSVFDKHRRTHTCNRFGMSVCTWILSDSAKSQLPAWSCSVQRPTYRTFYSTHLHRTAQRFQGDRNSRHTGLCTESACKLDNDWYLCFPNTYYRPIKRGIRYFQLTVVPDLFCVCSIRHVRHVCIF